jgi:hypothetical protein
MDIFGRSVSEHITTHSWILLIGAIIAGVLFMLLGSI